MKAICAKCVVRGRWATYCDECRKLNKIPPNVHRASFCLSPVGTPESVKSGLREDRSGGLECS